MGWGFPRFANGAALILLLAAVAALTACDRLPFKVSRAEREQRAAESDQDIVIGIVDSSATGTLFFQGVQLAVDEINQRGGVLNRRLQPLFENDQGDLKAGRRIARTFARTPDVVAVIGHLQDQVAIPVSGIYEEHGIVFLSPGAMDPRLTLFGENFTFRNIPSGEEFGRELARFIKNQGWERLVVLYVRQDTYRLLVDSAKAEVENLGIEVVATRSFFDQQTNFQQMLADINKNETFDAILVAGEVPGAAHLIKQVRGMGITVPILGTPGLDSPDFWTIAGRAAEGTMVATLFDPAQPMRLTREFVKHFKAVYGIEPDTWAAQGYDAVQVLSAAMEQSGSTVPIVLSNTLRFLEAWEGVTGSYGFTPRGDITEKTIFFTQARNGGFEFLADQADADRPVDPAYEIEEITLRLPLPQEPATLDPALARNSQEVDVIQQLFEGLTTLDPATFEAVPALAEHWTVSDDGTVYQFHLRRDAVWTDGVPVTAHDVVWAIRRNIAPDMEAPAAYMFSALRNGEPISAGEITDLDQLGVRAIDEWTVEFTLDAPLPYFPSMIAYPVFRPLPRHVLEAHPDDWTDLAQLQTSGPYRVALWERGDVLILRRNAAFYNAEQVAIPEVRYYIVPSSAVAFGMYQEQALDILGGPYTRFPYDQITTITTDPQLRQQYHTQSNFCTVLYGFNTRRPPTDNVLVRKALAAVVDRRLLIELSTRGGEMPASSFTVPPLFPGGTAPDAAIDFNPVQARRWLAEAGYPDGQGFPELSILYPTRDPEAYSTTAHPLQSFFTHYLNIPVTLQGVGPREYYALRQQPDTPNLVRFAWCADYPDPNNFLNEVFHPFHTANWIGWENQEFADLMDQAVQTTDQQQRQAMYARAEDILCAEEAAIIPLYYGVAPMLVNPRVENWYYMPINEQQIRNWSLQQ